MKRVLIFIGLKLFEVGKVVARIAVFLVGCAMLATLWGGFVYVWMEVWELHCAWLAVMLFVCLGVYGVWACWSDLTEWIKDNWEKAGKLAEGKK